MSTYRAILDKVMTAAPGAAAGHDDSRTDSHTGSRAYLARVRAVRELSDFLIKEGAAPDPNPALGLGPLNDLRWRAGAAMPNAAAWQTIETAFSLLHAAMPAELRKKYLLRQFPLSILWLAVTQLIISLLAFTGAVYPAALGRIWTMIVHRATGDLAFAAAESSIMLWDFIVWNITLGVLGSIAFISVNALSIQADASFDITNRAFVYLRIVLGALFGILIALPVAYPNFAAFCTHMAAVDGNGTAIAQALNASQVVFLILPFLIGFSTTLFLSLISRLIAAAQTLFGIGEGKTTTTAAPDGTRTIETSRGPAGPTSMLG